MSKDNILPFARTPEPPENKSLTIAKDLMKILWAHFPQDAQDKLKKDWPEIEPYLIRYAINKRIKATEKNALKLSNTTIGQISMEAKSADTWVREVKNYVKDIPSNYKYDDYEEEFQHGKSKPTC